MEGTSSFLECVQCRKRHAVYIMRGRGGRWYCPNCLPKRIDPACCCCLKQAEWRTVGEARRPYCDACWESHCNFVKEAR